MIFDPDFFRKIRVKNEQIEALFKGANKKPAGLSLMELLVTTLVMSIIILGVVGLLTNNLTLLNTQKNRAKAHFYAMQALEIVDNISAVKLTCVSPCYLDENANVYSLQDDGSGSETLDDGLFERTITHESLLVNLPNASLVTAEVKWTDSSGEYTVSAKRVIP